jgi:outer membrane protein TolC
MQSREILIACLAILMPLGAAPARAQSGNYSSATPSASAMQSQSPFAGSVPSKLVPGILKISLKDAIDRGLKQNLGLLFSGENVNYARGERWKQLSALLPNATNSTFIGDSQIHLAEEGFTFNIPGVQIPTSDGPFSFYDSRVYLSQTVFDWKEINRTRAATQSLKSAQHSYKDARDLVILATGYTYLQAIAGEARAETADAQIKTAQALYDQAADRLKAGTSPAIDALRAQVELKSRQQQFIAAKNNFEIQKLTFGRVVGLAPGQEFELTDKSLYEPLSGMTLDEALKRAYSSRSDFQAALADMRAAEYSRKAAKAGYLPTLSFGADYGVAADYPDTKLVHGVFDVRGTLSIPLFEGGHVHGDVLEADARLQQNRDRLESLRAQIDTDVRTALLNLESSSEQVGVAQSNIDLAEQTLAQARDRFSSGVTDTVEVVQAQEAVASAHENYIASLYAYNFAKISLARALGVAEEGVKEYFKGK